MKKLLVCLLCVFVYSVSPMAHAAEITLYATSLGEKSLIKSAKTKKITVDALSVEALVHELSQWTKLDFSILDFTLNGKKINIDWSPQSSLITGTQKNTPSEEFTFKDLNSLRWFMLDSLFVSLMENFDLESVSYTQDGGKNLTLNKLSPINEFPAVQTYKGSNYYFLAYKEKDTNAIHIPAPTVVDDAILFERTKGRWRLQGKDSPVALIVMDGLGGFSTHTLIGTLKTKGYLKAKYHDNKNTYEMYGLDKKFIDSFTIKDGKEFQLGPEDSCTYVKQ